MFNILNAIRCSATANVLYQQTRNSFILRRRYPINLAPKGKKGRKLTHRHHIYDLVQDTDILPSKMINVILTQYSERYGDIGDIVAMKPFHAYNQYLLPGFAVYDTPENREKFKMIDESKKTKFSSPHVNGLIKALTKVIVYLKMSPTNPWIIEPWHVRLAFNGCCIIVPDEAIELPETQIKGPDMSLENKEFYVIVTINKQEKVNVRCRIHHCDFDKTTKPIPDDYQNLQLKPLFPEQAEILKQFPKYEPKQIRN